MAFTVYDGIEAYARKANSGLYVACKTAIFNNPANQIYTPKGKVTRIREYESGMAGNYNKTKGWMTSSSTSFAESCKKYGFKKTWRNRYINNAGLKPSSTRKYICPCCGNSFRATKNIRVMCMDCNEQFVSHEMKSETANYLRSFCKDKGMDEIEICPHIDMKTADNKLVIGWLASQTDMLAEDWDVVE